MSTAGNPLLFDVDALAELDAESAVNKLLVYSVETTCSDVFFYMESATITLAVRRHGKVNTLGAIPLDFGRHMIGTIKAAAGMDIAEARRPQDGRWIHRAGIRHLDVRINSIPTIHGTDMTLRIWDRQAGIKSLSDVGLSRADEQVLTGLLSRPAGLMLITGPTGTGKTTTLYGCVKHLADGTRKINTLEDPVEIIVPGVRQSQVAEKIDVTFAALLRNILRQAPDVIMVGEIRDAETANIAVRAANSGHLVLASLHAPVAAGAVHTMLAFGSNPYFFASCLLAVVAQRLIRTLCKSCRVQYDISEAPQTFREIQDLLEPGEGSVIYGPGSCGACHGTGYDGRTGLFEIMPMNREVREKIAEGATRAVIEDVARTAGMIEFRRAALLKVAQGITSTEDLLRDIPAEFLGAE
jgi:type II secretory ATPase GspE/PulE/Tfp pilus assembly ATPase PilB-like protein